MRVTVDTSLCQGHGLCTFTAQDVFDIDDSGHAVVLVEDIPQALRQEIHVAVESCPERAISINEPSS